MKIHGMTPQRWALLCKRCGKCCELLNKDGSWTGKYCQYLLWDENHKAVCTVFEDRLGKECGDGTICHPIDDVFQRALNCPYNLFFPDTPFMKQKRVKKHECAGCGDSLPEAEMYLDKPTQNWYCIFDCGPRNRKQYKRAEGDRREILQ